MDSLSFDLTTVIHRAYGASLELALTKGGERNHALQVMLRLLKDQQNSILEANTLDLETSREMAIPDIVLGWLKLTPERLQTAVQILQQLAEIPDPLERVTTSAYQVDQYQTYCQQVPLGVIALIYEAFPELAVVAAGLCIKTGNSLILKGGSEASQSNNIIAQVLLAAVEDAGLPEGCLESLPSDQGGSIKDLVTQDKYINLIIPYGRTSLVQQVVRQSTAPVLRSAMGNCYLYWSPSGSVEVARSIILDSHQSEPDPVNAIEKVLIHRDQNHASLALLWQSLKEKGFEIRGDAELVTQFPDLKLVESAEWKQPYVDKIVAFKVVDSLKSAITWVNTYSSGHADCLVTESYRESRLFALEVNSASTYINASPRFSRNIGRGEDSVFLGMSNQKGYRRGLIGLEALTTTKRVVQGNR
jgi:glutamate-5-semialdehyde dehydrogenase